MTFREHEFNRFNPYVLHRLMNKNGLHVHVGYEFDDDLERFPTNSKDPHNLTSDSYATTRNMMTKTRHLTKKIQLRSLQIYVSASTMVMGSQCCRTCSLAANLSICPSWRQCVSSGEYSHYMVDQV